jgi:hypothetical protein
MEPTSESTPSGHVAGWWKRKCASLFRWLHIYVSMVSFGLLFFFAATGLTLNHADWFSGGEPRVTKQRGKLEPKWVAAGDAGAVAKLEVVEYLRRVHGVKGLVSEFRIEDNQCAVSFKGPGYSADALIERATGSYEVVEARLGFVAIINDLHKARDTGRGWSLVVDLSAALMIVVSLTGLVLIYFVKRRFVSGVMVMVAGVALGWLAYVWLVP